MTVVLDDTDVTIHEGDCLEVLRSLPSPDADDAGRGEHGRGLADGAEHSAVERGGQDAADPDGGGRGEGSERGRGEAQSVAAGSASADAEEGAAASDADGATSARLSDTSEREPHRRTPPGGTRQSGVEWGPYEPAIRQWEWITGRAAPRPTDARGRLEPAFVTWMMGLPEGWVDGLPRTHALRILGNAVVPLQAALAVTVLLEA